MTYTFDQLANVAECDKVLDRAILEKEELEHEKGGLVLDTNSSLRSTQQAQAELVSVNAQMAAFQAAADTLADGPDKVKMLSKVRKLNDRKENLEERLANAGNTGLLVMQMQRGLAEKQVEELNSFIAGLETRKAAI